MNKSAVLLEPQEQLLFLPTFLSVPASAFLIFEMELVFITTVKTEPVRTKGLGQRDGKTGQRCDLVGH